jgi:hypothetical protein
MTSVYNIKQWIEKLDTSQTIKKNSADLIRKASVQVTSHTPTEGVQKD